VLANVVIADLIRIDLVSQATIFLVATQAKNSFYHDQFLMNMFFF
jgi:hypothetical protein